MTPAVLFALAVFAFVGIATPGPNNLMLLASGANFGLRRTLPHMAGITLGLASMLLIVGLGLGTLFRTAPVAFTVLKAASVVYFFWLAWKIAHAAAPGSVATDAQPLSVRQAALFQWVNPKAWAMALGVITAYAPDRTLRTILVVMLVFLVLGPPLNVIWTLLGHGLRQILTNPARLTAFNWTMAALLVASLVPVLLH